MKKIKLAIVGTRGIPAKYGGFETFAEEISKRLVKLEYEVAVYCDKDSFEFQEFLGVKLKFINTTKNINPIYYCYLSLRDALKYNDIVYVTGVAGAISYWINIFYRKIIVTNTDGVEYYRNKWNLSEKLFLRFSEMISVLFSSSIIADSTGIKKHLVRNYHFEKKIKVIEYGANTITKFYEINDLNNLEPNSYYLIVARIEPENNIDKIIAGYLLCNTNKKLVIVGNYLPLSDYISKLFNLCQHNKKIIFLGGIYDKEKLIAIRQNCFAYIHGHSVGGTNPSLLEAMASMNIIIAHDNIFNREVTCSKMFYFHTHQELKNILQNVEQLPHTKLDELKQFATKRIKEYYNWELITKRYDDFFRELINTSKEKLG
ncbi:MAG: glycosyltransferase-like protein [Ignavibacteria bacterium]|nr:MAG: glycosyltransferase-like protein [Ignavibacteria bacterium]KAF0155451.1 MAG: glycosyltransferase-like protein [Ignavibacteria bacterium]